MTKRRELWVSLFTPRWILWAFVIGAYVNVVDDATRAALRALNGEWYHAISVFTAFWFAYASALAFRIAHHVACAGVRITLGPRTYSVEVSDATQKESTAI